MDFTLKNRYNALKRQIIDDFFSRMNPMQKQAVYAIHGPVLILAGAGSGKTTVIVNRIANMIQFGEAYDSDYMPAQITQEDVDFLEEYARGESWDLERAISLIKNRPVAPWNILAITFTNKAAGELKERLQAMLGEAAQEINASTFHSACVRILRREIENLGYRSSFTIYDTDDSVRVVKAALKAMNIDEKRFSPKAVLGEIGRAKDQLLSSADFASTVGEDFRLQVIAKVYDYYQKQLMSANAVDFDDIIMLTVRLFQKFPEILDKYRSRFRYVMVDEYQDTNYAQFMLVNLLASQHQNICVVGDDDQSIYKFRGADIGNILNFEDQFPGAKVIRLEENYRCTGTILDAANAVIENNTERKGKTLWTKNDTGVKIKVHRAADEGEEARFIADTISENVKQGAKFSDHAVLYRMNAISNTVERGLVKYGIPYRIIGGLRFYERKEIKDMISYLSVLNNPSDTVRLRRIINEPKRGIGDSSVNNVLEIAAGVELPAFEILENAEQYPALSRKATSLMQFAEMLRALMEKVGKISLDQLLDHVLEETGYLSMLQGEGFEGQTRLENIEELKSTMIRYEEENDDPTLAGFLEEISLYTDIDRYDPQADNVVLMTMHSAKGLEFENVILVGLEEGIFPGMQSMYDPTQIEEERRLAYVSLTRAKKRLYVTTAAQRMLFGQTMRNRPSRFLNEIPKELCEMEDTTIARRMSINQRQTPSAAFKSTSKVGIGAAAQPESNFTLKVGDMVSHKVFGQGMVLSITPMGNDHLVEVAFESVGTKKVMAKFARLHKIQ
ncbi:ATP-dependent helicase [Youxingia wuxianensis]|uniref:DNA 3'-5' helicase n=1 Tax=Youxingia wuxianensis TaxID=2763678 RepID=A0A926EML1_9FIRM|nr:UvrD-helicase domain-containing protein [Youxingia wuxianensis]MBC8584451.1 UvrD-helicase domain-containing protein [Youxingia wuxianensis]